MPSLQRNESTTLPRRTSPIAFKRPKSRLRGEILADLVARYESERCQVNGIAGTLWAAMNAVTEHADYSNGKRHVGTAEAQASRKFESVLSGDADELKQVAYTEAMKMTR